VREEGLKIAYLGLLGLGLLEVSVVDLAGVNLGDIDLGGGGNSVGLVDAAEGDTVDLKKGENRRAFGLIIRMRPSPLLRQKD